jgi:hypothetical protein
LTYKGSDKYRTFLGGLGTMISGFLVLSYVLIGLQGLINKNIVQINSSEMYNDIDDSEPVYPMKDGFNLSFGFLGTELPPGIGTYFV